jgi:NAD(P)-dependent dehydrogenase (short-subunit alcohol dehydrogenase family)
VNVAGKVVVVTGAASGIGRALARRFAAEGARAVICADRDGAGAHVVADEIGRQGGALAAIAERVDVAVDADVASLIERTERDVGPIDLFVSNAGIFVLGGAEVPNEEWDRIWSINVMAHVHAARALVPRMLARGGGYLLNTASAAGLLSQIGSAPYAVTKHAAVAFAEWLSITHGAQGLKVSVLCPQAVRTAMIAGTEGGGVAGVDGVVEPEQVADAVIEGLADERFLILPHPQVLEYVQRKGADYERWIRGMRRLQERFT